MGFSKCSRAQSTYNQKSRNISADNHYILFHSSKALHTHRQAHMHTLSSPNTYVPHTFSSTVPPLIWISIMCAFFCFSPIRLVCVWQMALMILQYFFILPMLSSINCLPASSSHFLAYLVKAFLFDAALAKGKGIGVQEAKTHQLT